MTCDCKEWPCPVHDPTQYKLLTAISALERIVESDPGPAYYIAKGALEDIAAVDGGVQDHTMEVP